MNALLNYGDYYVLSLLLSSYDVSAVREEEIHTWKMSSQ